MQSLKFSQSGRDMDVFDASKAPQSGTLSHSRSTSAGSFRSQSDNSVDLQKNSYATDASGLPEYEYPTSWSIEETAQPLGSNYPPALIVKYTFLGTQVNRPASLEEFFVERGTKSCPASGIGLPPGLEDLVKPEEAAARLAAAEAAYLRKAEMEETSFIPSGLFDDPQNWETPDFLGALQQQRQPVVLDLMQALSTPLEDNMRPEYFGNAQYPGAPAAYSAFAAQRAEAVLGSPECPTVGSQGHHVGNCKPCAFLYTKGCSNGVNCSFCHLCEPGEKKKRAKENRAARRGAVTTMQYPLH
jgi:hypothetical protein